MNALDAAVDALALAKNTTLDGLKQDKFAEALAAATIALAQQQRIANLIALDAFKSHRWAGYSGPSLIFGNPESDFGNVLILPEIREGLGL